MNVYRILGRKQCFVDRSQAILTLFFFLPGAIIENLFFLVVCPVSIFATTFFIREKYFGGKPEWAQLTIRMITGKRIYYTRQIKDKVHTT